MQMTHPEARNLIQHEADQALPVQEKQRLAAHLAECAECRAYAAQLRELETVLVPLLKRQWTLVPPPHSMASILARCNPKVPAEAMLSMRTVLVGLALLAFVFSTWQSSLSGRLRFGPSFPAAVLPVPTPSLSSTSTLTAAVPCDQLHYRTQAGDTLESIASHFAVSKEELMGLNHLGAGDIVAGRDLLVPLCTYTPTSTQPPADYSTRSTPSVSPIASTPGG